jgi:hypothetical protein
LQKKLSSIDLANNADKGKFIAYKDGTTTLTQKSITKFGPKSKSKSYLKPMKNGETVGKTSPNSCLAGTF